MDLITQWLQALAGFLWGLPLLFIVIRQSDSRGERLFQALHLSYRPIAGEFLSRHTASNSDRQRRDHLQKSC